MLMGQAQIAVSPEQMLLLLRRIIQSGFNQLKGHY